MNKLIKFIDCNKLKYKMIKKAYVPGYFFIKSNRCYNHSFSNLKRIKIKICKWKLFDCIVFHESFKRLKSENTKSII